MTTKDLLNTLEDLTKDEFKDFKWYLQQPDTLEGYQTIKASKLEKAERRDTVSILKETFTLQGALKVTKKVLKKINRNDLVQSLPESSSGPEGQSQFVYLYFEMRRVGGHGQHQTHEGTGSLQGGSLYSPNKNNLRPDLVIMRKGKGHQS